MKELVSRLRLAPFDVTTPEGRANERRRRLAFSVLASGGSKVAGLLTNVISLPLTFNYLRAERFGVWAAISSLSLVMTFADIGVGNGLMNAVAAADGRGDRREIQRYVSSSVCILSIVGLVLLVSYWIVSAVVSLPSLLNARAPAIATETSTALATFAVLFALKLPSDVVTRVQAGLQLSFIASAWQIASSLLSLAALLLAVHLRAEIPTLLVAIVGVPIVMAVLNSIWFFGATAPELRPSLRDASWKESSHLLRLGAMFFILQAALSLGFAIDPLVISNRIGPESVAEYAVPARLFEFVYLFVAMFTTPLWPAYAEATARGDHQWVLQTVKSSLRLCVAILAPTLILLALLGQIVIAAWVDAGLDYSMPLLFAFAIWTFFRSLGSTFSMFLNGIGVIRAQAIVASCFAIAALIVKVLAVSYYGVPGLVVGSTLVFVMVNGLPYVVIWRSVRRDLSAKT